MGRGWRGDGPGRREHLLILGQDDLKAGRQGRARLRGQAADEVLGLPAEEVAEEAGEIAEDRRRALHVAAAATPGGGLLRRLPILPVAPILASVGIGERGEEAALQLDRAARGDRLPLDERRRRDDEAAAPLLKVVEPSAMITDQRVVCAHISSSAQLDTGQR